MERAATSKAVQLVFRRDLMLAWRRWDEVTQPLIFYVVVTTLFPLATTPDLSLREPALGRFDATPGADLLHWNSDRKLDLARSGVAPRVAHGTEERF